LIAADCDDHNACTQDSCDTSDRTCDHEAIDHCCTASPECDDQNPCTTDSCVANACQHAAVSTCGLEDDAGAPPGPLDASVAPDSGSPSQPDSGSMDASVAPDSGSPSQPMDASVAPDSGSSEPDGGGLLVDAGQDAGLGNGGDDGCQCRLSQQRRPVPNMLIAFGLLLALRIGRRRKR
jgi:MYXO-CTERM domain-containing protein